MLPCMAKGTLQIQLRSWDVRWFYIVQDGPNYNLKCSYKKKKKKKEADGDLIKDEEVGNVILEANARGI